MPSEIRIVPTGSKRVYKPRKPRILTRKTSLKKRLSKRRIKRSTLVTKLDQAFSLWVRTRYADKDGWISCFTCNKQGTIKTMQNGHYVSRSVRSLRWDEQNCRPQCFGCNVMRGGQPITFRENLVRDLGEEKVLQLEAKRHDLFTPTDEWLTGQVDLYTRYFIDLRKSMVD